ncbi:MAG: hypothetical protein Fur0032_13880 [Terrimicrobiaceae bacterium]
MNRSLRSQVIIWFAFVSIALCVATFVGYSRLASLIRSETNRQITGKLDHVQDVLEATDSIYNTLLSASLQLLEKSALSQGAPSLIPGTDGGLPVLRFGNSQAQNDHSVVDQVTRTMRGTATIFVRDGENFVRVATNVPDQDGGRATGTFLDPTGPAIAALRSGLPYVGPADILGQPYITRYAPIFDQAGSVVGAFYVGYPILELSTLRDSIEDHSLLGSGLFAMLDSRGQIIFRTANLENEAGAENMIRRAAAGEPPPPGWIVKTQTFAPWDYMILAAMKESDVQALTIEILREVYGLGGLIIIAILAVSYWLARRLSEALEIAETSRQEALAARDAAESANRTKSTFLANMSHELRTPMNAIIGYSEMLIEEAGDLDQKEFLPDLKKIRSAGKHLLALINDILDVSKIEAGKMTLYLEDFDVADIVSDVASTVQPLIEKNGNTLEVVIAPEAGTMHADLTKLRQTLFNLLSNAAKFTSKGYITLRVDTPDTGRLRFSVTDTGIGMTEDQLVKLFQAFSQADASTTRKYGGTGLGLVICRKFCEMMGGTISVTSRPGEGTTFTAELPRCVTPLQPEEIPSNAQPSPGPGPLVLIIDDDADSADILRRNLEKQGYRATIANSGARGLELARSLRPAAITLDVMMPGMDGWSVLSGLKSDTTTADIPVIMVTMVQDRQLGFALGAAEFLTKPVNPERLRSLIASHCGPGIRTALIVEDDPSNRQLLVRQLEKEGFAVLEAENGQSALDLLATNLPSIILLDLMMPVMDGFQFLQALRSDPAHAALPVIVVTAKDLTTEERSFLTGRVSQILEKGAVNRDQLLQQVAQLVRQSTSGQ